MKKITMAKIEDWVGFSKLPPFLRDGFIISMILHMFFLVLIMVSPYIKIRMNRIPTIKFDEPIIVDLENVVVDKKTNVIAKAKAEVEKTVVKKEEKKSPAPAPEPVKKNTVDNTKKSENFFAPEIAKKKPVEQKLPEDDAKSKQKDKAGDFIEDKKESKPEVKKPEKEAKETNLATERMGGLDDLLASVDGMKRTKENVLEKQMEEQKKPETAESEPQKEEKTVEIKKGIETSNLDDGIEVNKTVTSEFMKKTMAISYIDAVRVKLRSCWHLDGGAKGVKDMKIVLRTSLSPDGNVNSIEILNQDEYISSPWFKAVADSARRALIVCSPYSLPVEYYKDWKDIIFTFYPDKKSVQ